MKLKHVRVSLLNNELIPSGFQRLQKNLHSQMFVMGETADTCDEE